MKKIIVDLGERSYPIYAGDDLLGKEKLFSDNINSKHVMIVSNTTVAPLYLDTVMQSLKKFYVASVILADG